MKNWTTEAREGRQKIRAGFSGLTTGLAPGFLQGNLVILPQAYAEEFIAFCNANATACPILGVSRAGDPRMTQLAADFDLRTDIGRYRILRDGVLTEERTEISDIWRDDFVSVVLGCWFSNEAKLAAAGVRMRHLELGIQGSLFRTQLPCESHGRFTGNLVVSMRPFLAEQIDTVVSVTSAAPLAHGAPVHVGNPAELGILNLGDPDFGEPILPLTGEKPVFWACGLTASLALETARPPIAITHAPGRMVITDLVA